MRSRLTEPNDQGAVYALHVEGVLGPLLRSSLLPSAAFRTEEAAVVIVSVTDDDLVEVAEKLASVGVEISSVRELATEPATTDQVDAPRASWRIRYNQNS